MSLLLTRLAALLLLTTTATAAEFSGMSYLDNGVIRIGADLDIGGAITYLSPAGKEENMINSHDWGRQIQLSFYSGPVPFMPEGAEVQESWRFLGWNPIQSGDCFGNKSKVITHENDGDTLYVKCIPMHWPLNNVPGECTFEVWITLDGPTAKIRSRLNNMRDDHTQYPARGQELPAIYTNGPYYRLFTYTGGAPFTGGELHQVTKVWDTSLGVDVPGGPWDHWYATENWAALVRDDDYGVGVWSPGTYRFVGGFAGKPGAGGPKDGPTGYIAPTRREMLDHNIEYAFDYVLVVGKLQEIRDYVYAQAEKQRLPHYDFSKDRQSWVLQTGQDEGWPLKGAWNVRLQDGAAALQGPAALFNAADAPRLFIRAAFPEGIERASLAWERFGQEGDASRGSAPIAVTADGETGVYPVDLAGIENYDGLIRQLHLQAAGTTDAPIRIEYIGHENRVPPQQ